MKLRMIRANQAGESKRITHRGREYLSVPHVAVIAGVLNGELVPAEELAKFPEAWNGRPVVIGHPERNGAPISANSPELVGQAPGQIWNTRFNGDRLLFEVWIDVEKAQEIGGQALEALERFERNEPTEGSTAYFREVEPGVGTFKGKAYNGIARNLRPDHYAILLDSMGACSWMDGCGGPRVNQEDVSESVIIAFYPPVETARQLMLDPERLPDGSEAMQPEDLHLTLAFLGRIDDLPMGQDEMMRRVAAWVSVEPLIHGTVDGLGRFNPGYDVEMHPIFATFSGPTLARFRERLVSWFEDEWPISRKHGFQPHITLAWVPATSEASLPPPERMEVVFDRIAVSWGDRVTLFPLQGETMQANVASRARRPSYSGTETTSWGRVSKTFAAFRDGYYRHSGADQPDDAPSRVQDAPAAMKRWIASKTLLGEAGADNERDLTFFPVVNPNTNRLNAGALRAVLGGRGAAADIPQAVLDSAQGMARRLLESEFEEPQGNESVIKHALVTLARAVGINLFKEAEMTQMGKLELCELLTANEQCKLKPETLEKLEPEELQALAESLTPGEQGSEGAGEQGSQGAGEQGSEGAGEQGSQGAGEQAQNEEDTPAWAQALAQKVDQVVERVDGLQGQIQANADQERTEIIEEIVAHQESIPKAALEKLELEELEKFRTYFVPVDFSGRGLPRSNSGEWEEYELPEAETKTNGADADK